MGMVSKLMSQNWIKRITANFPFAPPPPPPPPPARRQLSSCCTTTTTTAGLTEEAVQSGRCGKRSMVMSEFQQLPSLKYPWLVSKEYAPWHNFKMEVSNCESGSDSEEDGELIFSTILLSGLQENQHQHYHCQIPELRGRKLRTCYYGWLILSKLHPNSKFQSIDDLCLWNPLLGESIHLPRLELNLNNRPRPYEAHPNIPEGAPLKWNSIELCLLSSPPSEPDSLLLATRFSHRKLLFYPLNSKTKQYWTQVSFHDQLMNLNPDRDPEVPFRGCKGNIDDILQLCCCNGNVYANTLSDLFIQLDMKTLVDQGVLNLSSLGTMPASQLHPYSHYLIGNDTQLFTVVVCYVDKAYGIMHSMKLFKLDFSTMTWHELNNAKGHAFFLAEGAGPQISCIETEPQSPTFIQIISITGRLYSYNMEDKTLSLSSFPCSDIPPEVYDELVDSTWIMPENRSIVHHRDTNARSDVVDGRTCKETSIRSVIVNNEDDEKELVDVFSTKECLD